MPHRGKITGSRVEIPPSRLSPGGLFSRGARILPPDEIRDLNTACGDLLDLYGLSLASSARIPLRESAGGPRGPIEGRERGRLVLGAAIAAAAVASTGRGALLDLPLGDRTRMRRTIKERNDRASACALAEALFSMTESLMDTVCEVAIGEGVRLKPGEKGGNPTLYAGQVIGPPELVSLTAEERKARGVRICAVAVDAVEGTTKSAIAEGSSGCLLYVTSSPILRVPDIYFNRCHLQDVDGVDVDTDLPRIFDAIRRARGSDEINIFSLDRPRHPINMMAALGASVRTDADGDAFPVVAAGLGFGIFPDNGRPLDGVCGNIGGAAEVIASASAGRYLGVRTTARCAAASIETWEDRYAFGAGEEEAIRAAGFDPRRVYRIEELVPGIEEQDGLFVASAITDNAHIPLLDGVLWGSNFADVAVLTVGASGAADIFRLSLAFRGDAREAADRLTPVLSKLLAMPEREMGAAIGRALGSETGSRRLRHEFATTFYTHFVESAGRFRFDMKSAEASESEASLSVLRALVAAAPDWLG